MRLLAAVLVLALPASASAAGCSNEAGQNIYEAIAACNHVLEQNSRGKADPEATKKAVDVLEAIKKDYGGQASGMGAAIAAQAGKALEGHAALVSASKIMSAPAPTIDSCRSNANDCHAYIDSQIDILNDLSGKHSPQERAAAYEEAMKASRIAGRSTDDTMRSVAEKTEFDAQNAYYDLKRDGDPVVAAIEKARKTAAKDYQEQAKSDVKLQSEDPHAASPLNTLIDASKGAAGGTVMDASGAKGNEASTGKENAKPEPDVDKAAAQLSGGSRANAGEEFARQEQKLEKDGTKDGKRFAGLGKVLNAVGRPQDAKRSLDHAVELEPNDADAFAQRARARAMLGDRSGAQADARKALALDPRNRLASLIVGHGETLSGAGRAAGKKLSFGGEDSIEGGGERAESGRSADRAPSIAAGRAAGPAPLALAGAYAPPAAAPVPGMSAPRPSQALLRRAYDKMRIGDYKDALNAASAAIAVDRANPHAWVTRAEIDNQVQQYPAGVSDAQAALDLASDMVQAFRAKAYAEMQLGQLDKAMADIERAIKLDPDNGVGYLYRALIQEKLGNKEQALRDFDKADDLDPSLTPLTAEAYRRLGAKPGAGSAPKAAAAPGRRALLRMGAAGVAAGLLLAGGAGWLRRRRASEGAEPA